ncbi:MAG: hypothetical protein P8X57_15530 [Cyclobacteriaceae bacterium]
MMARPEGKPFVFWFGSSAPHRDYETNTGIRSGMKLEEVRVPEFLPDLACVRNDILDYYFGSSVLQILLQPFWTQQG